MNAKKRRAVVILMSLILTTTALLLTNFIQIKAEEVPLSLTDFEIDEDASADLLLYGDANKLDDGEIELTPLDTWRSGSTWYRNQIIAKEGFTAEFTYWAGGGRDDYYGGADGIVLIFSEETGLGSNGGYLGFVGNGAYGVELDSYPYNSGDPDEKHIAIIHNGTSDHMSYASDNRVDDSEWHTLSVTYKENKLNVYLDNVLVVSSDNVELPDKVYLGISAATGSGYNRHLIKDFIFRGSVNAEYVTSETSSRGLFHYASGSENDYTAMYYYDDNYFIKSSYIDQPSLMTMSMCLAFSAFNSNRTEDYSNKSMNLKDLLVKCGFSGDEFETNEGFRQRPGTDTIGVGASYKSITDKNGEKCTLLAVAVRGGGYESEWASNVTLGVSGTHQGFTEARDQVLDFLKAYVSEKKQNFASKVKLWIVGYSRAAATTNLVAAKLDDGYLLDSDIELKPKDLYAFCFESPQGALRNEHVDHYLYSNILSVINPVDFVTKVAPTEPSKKFGFARYGRTFYLPTALEDGDYGKPENPAPNSKLGKMLDMYASLDSTESYIVDKFQMKKISVNNLLWDMNGVLLKKNIVVDNTNPMWNQEAFLDTAILKLFSIIGSRQNYVAKYEKDVREICSVIYGTTTKEWEAFKESLVNNLTSDIKTIAACIVTNHKIELNKSITNDLIQTMKDVGITDYSKEEIERAAAKISTLLIDFGALHPNLAITMILNGDSIKAAHYPELCLSWLMSFDDNYKEGNTASFGTGAYRVVRINCPVDVKVYDAGNNLVAEITNDNVADTGSSIVTYINEDGEKLVYLPFTEAYKIDLEATDKGTMDYSVNEYSENYGGINRVVNYYDIPLTKGAVFESQIPLVSAEELVSDVDTGTDVSYKLFDQIGEQINPDLELMGEEVADATYSVSVKANNERYGYVTGNNIVVIGGYAQVTATANEGYYFAGWYDGETLVSKEADYRFAVTSDIELQAVFEADKKTSGQENISDQQETADKPGDSGTINLVAPIVKASNTTKGIKIHWNKVAGSEGYYIYRKLSSGAYTKVGTVGNTSSLTYTDKDSSLKNGKLYTYAVQAYLGSSTGAEGTIEVCRLSNVSLSKVKSVGKKRIEVLWQKNKKAKGYQIKYSTQRKFTSSKIITVKRATVQKRLIGKLRKGKTYYIKMRAYVIKSGKKYYSSWSRIKRVRVK